MTVDPATLAEAGAGKKEALVRILAAYYPQVWRIATSLTGSRTVGADVARQIMLRSLVAAETWEHEEAPARWFRHHTVLAARDAAPEDPPADDVLLDGEDESDPGYSGFVRALRGLPQQQREAFLLNHGEGFDLRQLGIAMDCSVEAAGVHLRHATLALQGLAGDDFGRFAEQARVAHAASAPDESLVLPYARKRLRPRFWSALATMIGWLMLVGVIGGLGYGLWWIWPRLLT